MTDGLRWVAEAYPFGYSIIFCENLSPEKVLVRLGARRESALTRQRRQRSELNAARTSVEKSSGSSQAGKWPPLSTSLKYVSLG
ncbi:hypothetical protein GCM10023080_058940 [Streptomyces pseudoechinosporeus]